MGMGISNKGLSRIASIIKISERTSKSVRGDDTYNVGIETAPGVNQMTAADVVMRECSFFHDAETATQILQTQYPDVDPIITNISTRINEESFDEVWTPESSDTFFKFRFDRTVEVTVEFDSTGDPSMNASLLEAAIYATHKDDINMDSTSGITIAEHSMEEFWGDKSEDMGEDGEYDEDDEY